MITSITSGPNEEGRYQYRVDKLNVDERWVDDAVARAAGYRITDRHKIPEGIENCDYAFGDVLIELKILERDVFEAPERQQKLVALFEKHGITGSVDSTTLPSEINHKIWEITMSGVENLAKKANRQIKATAQLLGLKKFTGVILLVNKECESIEAKSLKRYTEHVIRKVGYSSLHCVSCFSAIPAIAPGSSPIIGVVRSDGLDAQVAKVLDALADAFKAKVEEALGKKIADAPADVGPLSNIREDRTFTHGRTTVTFASTSRPITRENWDKMKDQTGEKPPA